MGRSTINASLASKTLLSTGIPVNTVAISVPSALDGLRRSFSHRVRVAARSDGRFGVECVFLEKCWSKRWRVHAVPGGTRPPVPDPPRKVPGRRRAVRQTAQTTRAKGSRKPRRRTHSPAKRPTVFGNHALAPETTTGACRENRQPRPPHAFAPEMAPSWPKAKRIQSKAPSRTSPPRPLTLQGAVTIPSLPAMLYMRSHARPHGTARIRTRPAPEARSSHSHQGGDCTWPTT